MSSTAEVSKFPNPFIVVKEVHEWNILDTSVKAVVLKLGPMFKVCNEEQPSNIYSKLFAFVALIFSNPVIVLSDLQL